MNAIKMPTAKIMYTTGPQWNGHLVGRYVWDDSVHYSFEWEGHHYVNQVLPQLKSLFIHDRKYDCFLKEKDSLTERPSHHTMDGLVEHEYDDIVCYAVERNCPSVVAYLAENGFDMNSVSGGERPLHRAIQDNYFQCAKVLLDHGADINGLTSQSNTPLHYAYMWGNMDMVEWLIKCGADKRITNSSGQRPHEATIMSSRVSVSDKNL